MFINSHRTIAHMDMDAFFVSVECLKNPGLKGKPLLVGGKSDRAVVAACSYEARRFGIHSAMPMKLARRLCPEAIIISGDLESYSSYSQTVTEIIAFKVPHFEKASVDEFYIDMTGMDRFFGCSQYAGEIKKLIHHETGLTISYGLSTNKLVSKVATDEAKPNGQLEIPFGNEKRFLAPLPVMKLPMVGYKTGHLLMQMGVRTVQTLSEIPIEMMENLLGKNGIELWRRANGIDESPVIPFHEQKSISGERTFDADTIDIGYMRAQLVRITEKNSSDLRSQNRLTGCITVKLRYSGFDTVTRQIMLPFTALDHLLIKTVLMLFEKLYDRRLLVRLVGVRFSNLVPGNYQISLFDDSDEKIRMYQAIDKLHLRFGKNLIQRASGML
ncbi:MAG: DNA polymerase IV [Chitinophagaceae bacterium]|nr:DNA polymerase IV [Chitinophagaceae bacterium]